MTSTSSGLALVSKQCRPWLANKNILNWRGDMLPMSLYQGFALQIVVNTIDESGKFLRNGTVLDDHTVAPCGSGLESSQCAQQSPDVLIRILLTPPIQRFIQTIALPVALALAATFVSLASHAAGSVFPAVADYQLTVEQPDAFRLAAFKADTPPIEARDGPVISVRFSSNRFAKLIDEASRKAALDPALVHALIAVESAYNPAARSVKGAIGLMQVLPATATRYGVSDPASSPEANLRAGTRYLRYLMELFDNRIDLVLAAYNAGENAVLRYGHSIPPFRETQQYVPAVLARYHEWREPASPVPPVTLAAIPASIRYMSGTALDFGAMDTTVYHAQDARRRDQR